jgi:hypothetical protein
MPQAYGSTGVQQSASAPAVGRAGSMYYNITNYNLYVSTGAAWVELAEGDVSAKFGNGDFVLNNNPFGGRKLYNSALDNAMFRARDRWIVTGKLYDRANGALLGNLSGPQVDQFFDGNCEDAFQIAANNYVVINVNFNGGYSPGFPYGYFVFGHYYIQWTESISVRVYCNYAPHGLGWHTLSTVDEVRRAPDNLVQKAYNGYYAISEVEFTFTAPPTTMAQVTEIDWQLDRPMTLNEMPVVDKYKVNTLYADLFWKSAGVETARISANGTGNFTNLTVAGTKVAATGENYLAPVTVATTANITLSGTQTIDSIAIGAGERVLVKNQTAGGENGIYVVAAGAWSRAGDADTAAKVAAGTRVKVITGVVNQHKIFTQLDGIATVGTETQVWRSHIAIDTGGLFTFPSARGAGQLYYNLNQRAIAIWDGLKWVYSAANVWTVTSSTRPTYVQDGLIIYETDTGLAYIWVGGTTNAWVAFGGGSGGGGGPATTAAALTIPDTRAVATIPNDYSAIAKWQFKQTVAIGLPNGTTTSYAHLWGFRGYPDSSGGAAYEYAYVSGGTESGNVYRRSGFTTTWSAWQQVEKNGFGPVFVDNAALADPLLKTEVRTTKLDYNPAGMGDITLGVSFNMNNQKIYGMADPVNPDHATTKNYVDNKVAAIDYRPLGIIGMGQITANSANTANSTTAVDIAGLSVPLDAVAGRWYKLNVWCNILSTVAADRIQLMIRDGSTSLISSISQAPATTAFNMTATYIGQFTAGAHTVKVSIARTTGTGTITMQGSATSPAQFVVEDIGT